MLRAGVQQIYYCFNMKMYTHFNRERIPQIVRSLLQKLDDDLDVSLLILGRRDPLQDARQILTEDFARLT